ncbi:hypothetical protein NLM59_04400 [Weeksellaceae bacterium KMM 9724]|uniref:hypothetical protein n=1 Tax=Profundicola chukchiensis TaxID=2961959 RepID=UPI00243FAE39|nr:hypothetical protein [Profundicola chukchiensis]MDG4950154.1 hypothetical protein [Profundicola chukchiensis]
MKNNLTYYIVNNKGLENLILYDNKKREIYFFKRKSSWFIKKYISIYDNQDYLLLEYTHFEIILLWIKIVRNNLQNFSVIRKNPFQYKCLLDGEYVIELTINWISIQTHYSYILLNGKKIGKISREIFTLGISFKIEFFEKSELIDRILIFILMDMSNKEISE